MEELHIPPSVVGARVLIVDTDGARRATACGWLRAWGTQASEAADGTSALAMLRHAHEHNRPYQLVMIGQHMPDHPAAVLAATIRREWHAEQPRLVLLAASDEPESARLAQAWGFDACLAPPLTQAYLFAAIAGTALVDPRPMSDARPPTSVAGPSAPPERATVLVAEDNLINQQVAVMQLHKLGYDAVTVKNGHEAVEAVRTGAYALVLMDCQMPLMDGFEATAAIRRYLHDAQLPIIAMTANTTQGDREQCLRSGMNDYLSKPLDLNALRAMLGRWTPASKLGSRVVAPTPATSDAPFAARQRTGGESALLRRLRAAAVSPPPPAPPAQTLDPQRLQRLRALATPDDPNFVQRLLDGFLRDMPQTIAALRAAIQTGDAEAVREGAHRCKGSSANFGAQRLGALCYELECMGRAGTLDAAPACLQQIEAEWTRVRVALLAEQRIAA
jgi:two-component system, sensor histidine kinase and response regulator